MDTRDPKVISKLLADLNLVEKKISDISGNPISIAFDGETDPNKIADAMGGVDKAVKFINASLRRANAELESFTGSLGAARSIVGDINKELGKLNDPVKKARQTFGKIDGMVQQLTYNQAELNKMSVADIKAQKKRTSQYFNQIKLRKEELKTSKIQQQQELAAAEETFRKDPTDKNKRLLDLKAQELRSTRELLAIAEDKGSLEQDINDSYDKQIDQIDKMNSGLGISGALVGGLGKLLSKIGFGDMTSEIDKAKAAMKSKSEELSEMGEKAVGLGGKFKVLGTGLNSIGKSLSGMFTDPLFYIGLLAAGFSKLVKVGVHIDHAISKVGKTLGLSRDAATQMTASFKSTAGASNDMFLNMDRILDAQLRISSALGTNVRLTDQQLGNQARLAEFVGLQEDELANVYTASLLTGKSQEDIYNSVVATNDSIFSSNELFKEAAGVTGQLAVNLGNNPAAIAKAVAQTKRLGINLETARDMAMGTLDFENSIAKEMEAQILTGKSINLNRARELAFAGDFEGAASEMLRQVGGINEFQEMNVLAQQALAESMGMGVDQLADMLTAQARNEKIAKRQQEIFKEMVGDRADQLTQQEKIALRGEAELKALRENQTVSERISNATAKIADIFGSMLLPIVEKFSDMLEGVVGFFYDTESSTKGVSTQLNSAVAKTAEIGEKAKETGSFFSGLGEKIKGIFGTLADYPVLSTLGAITGGVLAFKGLKALKGKLGSLLGIKTGKLGSNPNNPMYVSMSGASSSIMDMFKKPGGGMKMPKLPKMPKVGGLLKNIGPKLLKGSGVLSLVGAGVDLVSNLGKVAQNEDKGVGDALFRTLDENKFMALGAAIGSVVPGVGTVIGAGIGGILDFANKQILGEKGMVTESLDTPMATGGIVTKPTRALVGEAGAEAVIPLREFYAKMDELINVVSQGGDVMLDGVKVGNTLSLSSYKL